MKKVLFVLFAMCATHAAVAGVNKCIAADGKITLSDSPCAEPKVEKPVVTTPAPSGKAPASAAAKGKQAYQPGRSPFTDLTLKMLTVKCNEGVADACVYAAKVRAGNYGFADMSIDMLDAGCLGGEQSSCTKICEFDDTRSWCVQHRKAVPAGQNWYLTEVVKHTYHQDSHILCILPGQSDKVATHQTRLTIMEEGGRIRDRVFGGIYPSFNAAATAACKHIIARPRNPG